MRFQTTLVVLICLSVGVYWMNAGFPRLGFDVLAANQGTESARAPMPPCCAALGPAESSPVLAPLPAPADVGRVVAAFHGEPPVLHQNPAPPPAELQSPPIEVQHPWPSLKRAPQAVVATVPSEVVERWVQKDSCLIDPNLLTNLLTRPVRPDHERYVPRLVPQCETFKFDNGVAEVTNSAPGSLWRAFALRRGDRLQRINGYSLSHPEDALHLYASLPRPFSVANTCLVFSFERGGVPLPPRVLCLGPRSPHAAARPGSVAVTDAPGNSRVERVFWPVYEFSGAQTRRWLTHQDEDLGSAQPTLASTLPGRYEHPQFTLSKEGIRVRDASRGTPFHPLGLKVGDRVDTLNGRDFSTAEGVLRSYASFREAAFSSKLACVRLEVLRNGRRLTPRIVCLTIDD